MNAGMDDLYREVILDHHRSPRCTDTLEHADAEAAGKNPSCGDEVTLQLAFDGARISGISVRTAGCAIATASGSILGELLAGRTEEEAGRLAEAFRQVMHSEDGELADDLDPGDLEVLTGVRKFPVRVKCALLPWITLLEAVAARREGRVTRAGPRHRSSNILPCRAPPARPADRIGTGSSRCGHRGSAAWAVPGSQAQPAPCPGNRWS